MTALEVAHASEIYPSRNGRPDAIIERQDPVVYSSQSENSPVAYDLIKKYEQNGFLIINNIFSDREIRCFQDELERLRDVQEIRLKDEAVIEPGSGEVRSVFAVHNISPVFKKLASDRRLAAIAEYILGDHVYIHQSRVNYKPGFRGKEFYWHSDFETWHVEDGMPRMRALSMSIILTDNYEYNGPLLLIPKSHLDFVICSGETPANHFKRSLKKQEYGIPCDKIMERLVYKSGIFAATGNSGSVIIFDCNIMHGSNGNITPYPRSNIFLVYNAVKNRIFDPYCNQPPRPEWVAARNSIKTITPTDYKLTDYA